jgi:hypothetical protein
VKLTVQKVNVEDILEHVVLMPPEQMAAYKRYQEECKRDNVGLYIHISRWMDWVAYNG